MFGPKCCGFILGLSIWGTIFLAILGGLYYNESVGLLDDLPKESESDIANKPWPERVSQIKDKYRQNAYNSWIACGVYGMLTVVSGVRLFMLVRR